MEKKKQETLEFNLKEFQKQRDEIKAFCIQFVSSIREYAKFGDYEWLHDFKIGSRHLEIYCVNGWFDGNEYNPDADTAKNKQYEDLIKVPLIDLKNKELLEKFKAKFKKEHIDQYLNNKKTGFIGNESC